MNLEGICKDVNRLVKEVGIFIKGEVKKLKDKDVVEKGTHDLVTYVDTTSEEKLVKGLRKIFPKAGFIAEENAELVSSDKFNWVIDPLDGTTNFVHSIPVYSISIALMNKKEVVLGVIYEINSDKLFYSWKDSSAYLNNNIIRVSETATLNNSLLATGFPFRDFSKIDSYLQILGHFMQNSRGLRRMGSAAVDLAYVACGRFDGFFEYGLKPWDVAAGSFLVHQAGGKVSDFRGGNEYIFKNEIIAANNTLFEEIKIQIEKYF